MALYYQNFYILVVFVPFLHTSQTFVLPVHAVKDSAQVLEERVEHELGSWAMRLRPPEEPGLSPLLSPDVPVPGGREEELPPHGLDGMFPSSCFPDISTGAHGSV